MSSVEDAYREYRDRIHRFVRARIPPHADADDITQRVFLDALEAEGAEPASILGWLYTVARRRLVDELRRESRSAARETASDARVDPSYGPAVAAGIGDALAALPEAQRRVLVLRLLRGCSFAEIGRTLGISEPAAKMRFRRGLESVRRSLREAGIARDPEPED